MTDRGLKVLYIYETKISQDLHEGIMCINRRFLKEFVDRPGWRCCHWWVQEGIELSDEEECLLNSSLVYLHEH